MMLGLDIDGVLADFLTPFLEVVASETGSGRIPPESVSDFNLKEHPYLKESIVLKCMEQVSNSPSFWRELKPLITPEQWHKLSELSRENNLVFITHRYERDTYSIHDVSCEWLENYGIINPTVYFTQAPKARLIQDLGVSLFVDDRHENCEDVATQTAATVLMPDRTYNQSFAHPRVKRIWNFSELFDHLD